MEEIAEGLIKSIGSVIRWFFWHLLYEIALFNIGRFALLLITLGNYPRGRAAENNVNLISWVGIGVVVIIWVFIALYNNWLS